MTTLLNNHSHYSLQKAYCKIQDLVKKAKEYGYTSLALTDYDLMSGAIKFELACKDNGIKPIFGVQFSIDLHDEYFTLLAKNIKGYKELARLSSLVSKDVKLTLDDINDTTNIIVISQFKKIFDYTYIASLQRKFGDNYYFGIQNFSNEPCDLIGRDICELNSIQSVALNNTHYLDKSDRVDYTTLLCSRLKCQYGSLPSSTSSESWYEYFPTREEFSSKYLGNELTNTDVINSKCENFSLLGSLKLPKFNCPFNVSQDSFLAELCRDGWRRKISGKITESETSKYVDRIKYELTVISRAGLSGYFNVVQDYVNWAKSKGILCGTGRGSSSGCLISYLTNITEIDPLKYNLIFERFYNEGRNSPGKIACPDIDTDFPPSRREDIINYIREKYGADYVCQVATFSRLQGKGALKEIFRIHNVCDDKTMNEITKHIPDESEISDKLEEEEEESIIRWTLRNEGKGLSDWCVLENNEFSGPFSDHFQQAIRIEGTLKSYGKHASALIISDEILHENVPMLGDKSSNELLCGIEFEDMEKAGYVKFDILGLSALDKLMNVANLLKYGKIKG